MRVAIIGVGHWHAAMHLRSLQLADDVEIVGVSDPQAEIAMAFAERSGGRTFVDYGEMLESTCPDFVLAMGDDNTDEDIFKALPPTGNSIKVGADRTVARYSLTGVAEVRKMFRSLAADF